MFLLKKIVVITRKTQLDELIQRFNTREQARFYIEHLGGDFSEYEAAHKAYYDSVETLRKNIPLGVRTQWVDRSFLPTFTFGREDLVVTLGQDGLVVNTAKYLDGQPLLAFNPDPTRIDGILSSFTVADAGNLLKFAMSNALPIRRYTMAEAKLNDGRSILAVNDLFIGQKTHVSAKYSLEHGNKAETQSSSGIIVSTGAGSTGWYRSILVGAAAIIAEVVHDPGILSAAESYVFDPTREQLVFNVREPFMSRTSDANIVHGWITREDPLIIRSEMPQNGVIFSDGIEADYLQFNSGAVATIGIADRKLMLIRLQNSSRRESREQTAWK